MSATSLLHGSAAVLGTKGVLVQGPSGCGKSTLIHTLIAEYQRRNFFAQWIGDDQLNYQLNNEKLIVSAISTIAGKAEQAFHSIIEVPYTGSACIDLLVKLEHASALDRLPDDKTDQNFGNLPLLIVPERQVEISGPLVLAKLDDV